MPKGQDAAHGITLRNEEATDVEVISEMTIEAFNTLEGSRHTEQLSEPVYDRKEFSHNGHSTDIQYH